MSREQNRLTWEQRLERFHAAELTIAEFCRREDVSVASYYYWKRQLGASADSRAGKPLFVPVSVKSTARTGVRIELPGGATVHLPADASIETLQACIVASFADGGDSTC